MSERQRNNTSRIVGGGTGRTREERRPDPAGQGSAAPLEPEEGEGKDPGSSRETRIYYPW